LALTARLRRCSDCVSYVMYFCRAGEATTMPLPTNFADTGSKFDAFAMRTQVAF
jgi:hypothetical protein